MMIARRAREGLDPLLSVLLPEHSMFKFATSGDQLVLLRSAGEWPIVCIVFGVTALVFRCFRCNLQFEFGRLAGAIRLRFCLFFW